MSRENIRVRAGKRAYELIREGEFSLDRIATYFGPAGGPRWLVASGFDLTLIREGALGKRHPLWLVGASAGAWRFAAWVQPEPEKCYDELIEAYLAATYGRKETPETVLATLTAMVDRFVADDALPFALANKRYRVALLTCRSGSLTASDWAWMQKIGFLLAFLANALHPSLMHRFVERIVFFQGLRPPDFCLRKGFKGRFFPLSEINFKAAVAASGAIPLAAAGVRDIYEAPDGVYRDGGLLDYHINQDYGTPDGGLTLFFHHQDRIIPGWMDRRLQKRRPQEQLLDSVVLVSPSADFVESLPDGRIPDRSDFKRFIDDPATRIANWRRTVTLAGPLGEEFLELIASGRLREAVEPI